MNDNQYLENLPFIHETNSAQMECFICKFRCSDYFVMSINQNLSEFLKMNESEVLENHLKISDIVYDSDKMDAVAFFDNGIVTGKVCEYSFRLNYKESEVKSVTGFFLKTNEANEKCCICVIYDFQENGICKDNNEIKRYKYLNFLMEKIPAGIGVFEVTDKIRVVYANKGYYNIIGVDEEEYISSTDSCVGFLIHEDDIERLYSAIEKSMKSNSPVDVELRIVRNTRKYIWVKVSANILLNSNGRAVFYAVIVDISAQKRVENELFIQSERYKLIQESSDEIHLDYNCLSDCLTLIFHAETIKVTEKVIRNFLGDYKMVNYIHNEDFQKIHEIIDEATGREMKGAVSFRTNYFDNDYIWYRCGYRSFADDYGNVTRIVGIITNVNEQKILQLKLENEIKMDVLTEALNQTAIKFMVDDYLKYDGADGNHAMLLVDIDHFKLINEKMGYMFGDVVIKNIALNMKNAFRKSDFIGRICDDEFMVFMKNTNLENAELKAEEICNLVSRIYVGEGKDITLTCSIGIACFKNDGNNYENLFKTASAAMFRAKEIGGDCFISFDAGNAFMMTDNEDGSSFATDVISCKQEIAGSYKKADVDFISFAFTLLSNSKDLKSSLGVLIERIGTQFDLDMIVIQQNDCYANNIDPLSIVWRRNHGVKVWHNTEGDLCSHANRKREMIVINDVDISDISLQEREILKNYRIKSLVDCSFKDNDILTGHVSYCDCENTREWTEYESQTLYELSRIVYVFTRLSNEINIEREEITKLSYTDKLTGLYNSEGFKVEVKRRLERMNSYKVYAIAYIDINDFSYVNDNFGYEAGDKMLCDFAMHVKKISNSIGCRIYSDYFLVFVCDDSKDNIIKTMKALQFDFVTEQKSLYPASELRLSTGIYFIEPDCDINTAIENANLIRRSVKSDKEVLFGVYSDDIRAQMNREQSIISELHMAIQDKKLELFLQPKFSLFERRVIGAEALVRWRNKDGSLKFPGDFILILEKIGYVVELDFYIYEQVLKNIRKWQDDGITTIPISVNFSRLHTNYDDFVERVCSLADKYDVDRSLIEIEITESILGTDTGEMLDKMRELQNAGFRIDIDDFGTGYSSLSLLLSAPVDIVKVDKSFLYNTNHSEKVRKFVENLAKLLYSAEKEIIFEGVETEEQAEFLKNCGVTMAQGYLFDKAISVKEFEDKYIYNIVETTGEIIDSDF